MVKRPEALGNTYITFDRQTGAAHDDKPYRLQRGRLVKNLDRFQRESDPDFRAAWQGFVAGIAALRNGENKVESVETHSLDANHHVFSTNVRDYRGNRIKMSIFTERNAKDDVISVDISADRDRIHFSTSNEQDLRLVSEAFHRSYRTLFKATER
jgi:hypothetical protein